VVGRAGQPSLEHSSQLHYVNAFLTETLRKAAVAPSGLPHYVTGHWTHSSFKSSLFLPNALFSRYRLFSFLH
jgi:hypothetical protein